MNQQDYLQVKHFIILCPHLTGSNILDKAIENTNYPIKYNLKTSDSVLMAVSRTTSSTNNISATSLICGDTQDFDPNASDFLGNGIHIKQEANDSFSVASSLTGLPPLYIYRDSKCTLLSDNIQAIANSPYSSLHFDIESVNELAKIGFPIKHRTLFKEINIIPAGSIVTVSENNIDIKENVWQPSFTEQFSHVSDYIDMMSDLMQSSIRRMNTDNSFLSLTAGLDTRAILAALAIEKKVIDSFTISGSRLTLDAMRGKQLCSAYDIKHNIIAIDNALSEDLPEYAKHASLYSGGLNSIEQATEIYFYEMAGTKYTGRVSGNLGNQVGRSGSEGTGIRNASTQSLNSEITNRIPTMDDRHWFFQTNSHDDLLDPGFLIKQENLFAQISNYSIGHEKVTQQTPYADRDLINIKYSEPKENRDFPENISAIKMRDLKHRIIGQSPKHSFQCQIVQTAGGAVANTPINWGWTTKGSFSLGGLYYGGKSFTDILLGNKFDKVPGVSTLLIKSGIKGFSSFHTKHTLYEKSMQTYIKDLLTTQSVVDTGLFNKTRITQLIDGDLNKSENYSEVALTLDLALASQNFNAEV